MQEASNSIKSIIADSFYYFDQSGLVSAFGNQQLTRGFKTQNFSLVNPELDQR